MSNEKGQILLTLILVMTVALAIGLSVIQKSLVDVSTATKVEQSSRAFSAAEAGIEKYLESTINCTPGNCDVSLANSASTARVEGGSLIPPSPDINNTQLALEYPPLSKEEIAQVWLADPDSNVNLPACSAINPAGHLPVCYKQARLDVYWGDPTAINDKAALEVTAVYFDGTSYKSYKWYLDQIVRNPVNNFEQVACSGNNTPAGGNIAYQCKKTLDLPAGNVMLIRARLLYNTASQPFAAQALGTCGSDCSLPPQARLLTSTGSSGETQRKVQLFQLFKVVPAYFNYAIFSAGDINK